jgi:hypothetical protein
MDERLQLAQRGSADRFEDKTLFSYARLNEERGAILHDIVERGSIYHVQTMELS